MDPDFFPEALASPPMMANDERIYKSLTRSAAGLASYSSLWLGSDHLLLVSSTGYMETYQRIQLRDVQTFILQHSKRRLVWSIVWGTLAVGAAIPLSVALLHAETPIVSGIGFCLAFVLLLLNWLLGPSCRVYLLTRVQTTRLPFARRRKARKVLGQLQPLIEAAQADFVPEIPTADVASPSLP